MFATLEISKQVHDITLLSSLTRQNSPCAISHGISSRRLILALSKKMIEVMAVADELAAKQQRNTSDIHVLIGMLNTDCAVSRMLLKMATPNYWQSVVGPVLAKELACTAEQSSSSSVPSFGGQTNPTAAKSATPNSGSSTR